MRGRVALTIALSLLVALSAPAGAADGLTAGAAKIGKALRPTEVLIFGNPQGGTPFMECGQTVGIDLPLKALVWQDAAGQVWLGYNDPAFLAQRHGVAQCPAVESLKNALAAIAHESVAP